MKRWLFVALTVICQLLLGATFLFSGFVKAADPMGMEHKLEAYAQVLGEYVPWLASIFHAGTVYLDFPVVFLATLEFLLGLYFLLGIHQRLTTTIGLVFMVVLTMLTLYIFAFDPVPDCGCFGDAILLSNGETLLKNIVLLLCTVWLFVGRKYMVRFMSRHVEWLSTTTSFIYIVALSLYSLWYLPLIEFTGYKIGTDVRTALLGEYITHYHFEKNGEQKIISDGDAFPDSTWTLVDSESVELAKPTIDDFSMTDEVGTDVAEEVLQDSSFTFILTLPHFDTADKGCSDLLNDVYDFAVDNGLKMYCANALTPENQKRWSDRTGAAYPFVTSSAETLEAMVRSNPGLVLLHDGRIVAKWGHHDLPTEEVLNFKTLNDLVKTSKESATNRVYLWLSGLYVLLLIFVILSDRLWAGNKYYRRIRRAQLWHSPLEEHSEKEHFHFFKKKKHSDN